jgi:hypothetical protein
MRLHKNKCIAIIVLIMFVVFAVAPPKTNADTGPKGNEWEVIQGVGIAALLAAITFGIYKLYKHQKSEPVTAILFNAEDVCITIEDGEMAVDALFEYQNMTEKRLRMDLFFPFARPVKESISDLSVVLVGAGASMERRLDYTSEESRILFDFIIEPRERTLLKVHYREAIPETHAAYIITSIKLWHRPVVKATFTVKLPTSFKSPAFSFADSLVERINLEGSSYVVYKFMMRDLFPEKEFQIAWQ